MSYLGFDSSCASAFPGDSKTPSTHAIPAKKKVLPIAGRRNRMEILLPIERRRVTPSDQVTGSTEGEKVPLWMDGNLRGRNILPTGSGLDKCLTGFGMPQGRSLSTGY